MYTSTQRERPAGISSGSIDALRVQLMKMNSQQLQAFATANQDDAIKLGLAAEADKYKKQHGQEAMALMSGQQAQPPVAQQILQSISQPPQQPQQQQQPMPPQGQGMPPQGMPPQQMAQSQMPPQGMADGGYMLPEDQGIATLPSGNMDFAGGGIVAFGGGGDVPGYAGGVFTGPGTPEDYRAYAMQKAEKMGLNPAFVDRIFKIESGYDPLAKSGSGSTGIGQLVKSTARYYGLKTGKQDERLNPIMNIDASLAHMADLNKKYKGDPELIAVAYNQGEPTLDAHLRKNGGKLVPEKLQQEIATKLKTKGALTDTQIAARAVEPVNYLAKINAAQIPTAASLGSKEELVQPTQAVDNSIPTNYKQEQAARQAPYDDDVKKLRNESIVDRATRVGKGLVGYGEAGLNLAGQLTGYPMGMLYGVGSNVLTGENKDVGKQMEDYVRDVSYDPRTPEGQQINELKNKFLSGLPAYMGKVSGAKPTKAAGKSPIVEPGITALTESPAAKAAESTAPVKPQALGTQMELFPQESMPATAPRTSAAPVLPIQQTPKTPLQLAQEKQIAARTGLTALPGADNFVGPKLPISVTPENLAVRAEAAARLQGKTPVVKPTTGKAFEVTPESAEIAAQARARLANQKAAAPMAPTEPRATTEPAVSKALGMSPEEMLNRALEAERINKTGIGALSKENVGNAVLPGAAFAVSANDITTTSNADIGTLTPNENIKELPADAKKDIVDKLKDTTGASTGELKQQAADSGMDWNSFLLRFGLGLMTGESPNALVNAGKAGLGALEAQLAEKKYRQAQAASVSDSELKKMQAKYYGSYANAIERGAKEKNEVMQAETLVQQHIEKWLSSGPGLIATSQDPNAAAKEEKRYRKSIYLQLGLNPIMSSNTPAGGAKFLGFENPT